MKTKLYPFALVLLLLTSCGDEHIFNPQVQSADAAGARYKFVHAASDTMGMNLFADGVKLTGGSASTITTYGSVNIGKVTIGSISYGNSFPVTDYSSTATGTPSLSAIFPETFTATVSFPAKTIVTKAGTLSAGKFHTVALVGNSPSYDLVVFEDNLQAAPLDGKAYLRFANFLYNQADPVKVVITPPATTEDPSPAPITLFQGTLTNEMKDFVALPRTGTYKNLQVINETTLAVIYTLTPATSTFYSFLDNKAYTIFARGKIGGTGGAAPSLGRMVNR